MRLAVGAHHEVAEVQGVVDEAHPAAVVGAVSAVIAVDEAADVVASARGVGRQGVVVSPVGEVGVNDSRLCIIVRGMYTSFLNT